MSSSSTAPVAPEEYREAIRAGDRRAIARTITLLESTRPEHSKLGLAILDQLDPDTGSAIRVGITGPPGAGKSSLIETLGLELIERGNKVAVLAVDPTSPISGGSILGDKTRMEVLARNPNALIRPSPSGDSLGGVAQRTREAMLVCEAAGFDVVLVETVGVGQSQIAVAAMVDFFLLVLLPGGGDELQGIKKGIVEMADALLINKADGATAEVAERTRGDYAAALGVIRSSSASWSPPVLKASAVTGLGIPELWEVIVSHRKSLEASGEFLERRQRQARAWMWSLIEEGLGSSFRRHPAVQERIGALELEVEQLETSPGAAARELLSRFLGD